MIIICLFALAGSIAPTSPQPESKESKEPPIFAKDNETEEFPPDPDFPPVEQGSEEVNYLALKFALRVILPFFRQFLILKFGI